MQELRDAPHPRKSALSKNLLTSFSCSQMVAVTHPVVGQRGVVVLRVELQGDKGHVAGDAGGHGLDCLVLEDPHVLEDSRQENQLVCQTEGGRLVICYYISISHLKQSEAAGREQESRGPLFFLLFFDKTFHI